MRLIFFFLTATFASQSGALSLTGVSSTEAEITVVGTNLVSLGTITYEKTISVPFHLRNTGQKTVKITHLIPTCTCIAGQVDKTELRTNEETVVMMIIDPSSIKGHFKRHLWVKTNIPNEDSILLTLVGEVTTLFTGEPEAPVFLAAANAATTLTNSITLKATKPNIFLGTPVISEPAIPGLTAVLTTNQADTASYTLTLILKPLTNGFQAATVSIPVEGQKAIHTLKIIVHAQVGGKLTAAPSSIVVTSLDEPMERRVRIAIDAPQCDASNLTVTPHIDGLDLSPVNTNTTPPGSFRSTTPTFNRHHKSSLFVLLKLSPAAIKQIMSQKDHDVVFHYPGNDPISIPFVLNQN